MSTAIIHDNDRVLARRGRTTATAERFRHAATEQLVNRARAGDRTAFEELVRRYERQIFGLTYRMLGDVDEARDLTQESFLRAYTHLPRTRGEMNFPAWLRRIASNACLDTLRRKGQIHWLPWNGTTHDHLLRQRPADNPERAVIITENALDVQHVLNKLHPHYRLALLLREYDGMSTREVGEVMDLTYSATKSVLFRARRAFRTLYDQEFDELARA